MPLCAWPHRATTHPCSGASQNLQSSSILLLVFAAFALFTSGVAQDGSESCTTDGAINVPGRNSGRNRFDAVTMSSQNSRDSAGDSSHSTVLSPCHSSLSSSGFSSVRWHWIWRNQLDHVTDLSVILETRGVQCTSRPFSRSIITQRTLIRLMLLCLLM